MLQRLLTASFIALLVAGGAPAAVLAAAPIATSQSIVTDEDTGVPITLTGTDEDLHPLVFDVVAGPGHGSLTGDAPDLVYTPGPDYNGSDSFTFTASDGVDTSDPATISITVNPVNDPPVAVDDPGTPCGSTTAFGGSFPIPEDWNGGSAGYEGWFAFVDSCAPLRNDVDPDGDELTLELVGTPAHGEAAFLPDGFLAYDPDPDYSTLPGYLPGGNWASDTIHYRVFDGSTYSGTASYQLWISPVNDAPSFKAGGDVTVDEDSDPYAGAWATAISPGPGESEQVVDFIVDAVSNPTLFASAPSVSSTGELSFEPAPDLSGQSTVTVHAHDDGGLEDYGVAGVSPDDTSDPVVFTISVTPTNDAPAPVAFSTTAQWGFQWLLGELTAYDVDGDDTTAFAIVTPPGHGSLEFPSPILCQGVMPRGCGRVVLYTAEPGYVGQDSFTYTATDGAATSAPATVTINVTDNAAPACDDASSAGAEEASQGGNLPCSDAENEELTFSLVTGASHGAATVAPDGSWGYQPNPDFNGVDSFTFQAADPNGTSNTATMAITVDPVNDAPACTGFAPAAGNEDASQAGTIATCSDVESSPLTYAKVAGPSHGTATVTTNGSWTYMPAANYSGPDSFTFRANDGTADSNTATVTLSVTSVNDAPVCTGDTSSGQEDTQQAGTIATCSDADGDPLTYSRLANGTHGAAIVAANGTWTYLPGADYHGPDAFNFRANDGSVNSNTATMSVTVSPVNDPPVCAGATLATDKNVPVDGAVTCTDIDLDTLVLRIGSGPSKGSVAPFDTTSGAFTYTPAAGIVGTDAFTVIAFDGTTDGVPATVEIGISNHAPVCSDAAPAAADEDAGQAGTITCADEDLDPLTFSVISAPAHGVVDLDPDTGDWTYLPDQDWSGADVFTARASDGAADSNTATVSLSVTAVNDVPVADDGSVTVDEDTTANTVAISGSDVESPALTYTVVTQPAHGTLNGTAPALEYTPAANYNGPDSFTFTVNDGALDSAPATVELTVTDVNDAPDARSDASGFGGFPYVTAATTGTLNVLGNDSSAPRIGGVTSEPGDPITITSTTGAGRGTVSIVPGGTALAYDPRGCLTGDDVFSYTVTDGHGLTDVATVAVTVARPGEGGVGSLPITDVPAVGLRSGASIGSTVPVRVTWCGVVRSGSKVKGYRVLQSGNGGASYPTLVASSTTATSTDRAIGTVGTYAWQVRTTDSASRTGAYRPSATAKAAIRQETPSSTVVYSGTWRSTSTSKASGGRLRSASSTAASVTIAVPAGTRQVGIVGPKGSGYGSFKVWIDGTYAGSFSERSSSSSYKKILFVRSISPAAGHTIVLKPAGNGRVYLDAVVTLQ